tara:strand:+ start:1687 stop:2913 length:1227 start_codon:yes stop_codon:yes gene_type:complete
LLGKLKVQKKLVDHYKERNDSQVNISISNSLNIFPLPLKIWPYEAKLLFVFLCIWCIGGLFILGSASGWVANEQYGSWAYFLKKQIFWYVPGLIIFYLIINSSIKDLLKISNFCFHFFLILIIGTIFFGSTINGSSRWLILGPLRIQPSELIKPFSILQAANLFAHWKLVNTEKKIIKIMTFSILIVLIMKQPNLSTASLTGILFWIVALCGGVRIRSLFSIASLGAFCAYVSIMFNEYQMLRITSFLNPWNAGDNGYQLVQSLLAIGSGGLFGQGFGLSMQKLKYLPIQHTDFIFAIYAEEFGFMGSIFLLSFLAIFSYLCLRIALKCRNNYTKLVTIGSGTLLIAQSLLHIAVTTGSMPTTGLPFPLISYGGNSLISSLAIGALLLRCSLESTGLIGILYARKSLN